MDESNERKRLGQQRLSRRALLGTAALGAGALGLAAPAISSVLAQRETTPTGETAYHSRSATLVVAASDAAPQSKLGADFVCDGTADEVEINAALNALGSRGGKVVLTEGRFNIASPILIPAHTHDTYAGIHLEGCGWQRIGPYPMYSGDPEYVFTTLVPQNVTCIQSSVPFVQDVQLSRLKIEGNVSGTDTVGHGIHAVNGREWNLSEISINHMPEHGIYFENNVGYPQPLINSFFRVTCKRNGGSGFEMESCADSRWNEVLAGENGSDGIHVTGSGNNFFTNVFADLNGGNGMQIENPDDSMLVNCIGEYNGGNGIALHGNTGSRAGATVVGCVFRANTGNGCWCDTKRIKFVGCSFNDKQETPTQGWGIYVDSNAESCIILGCEFYGNTSGQVYTVRTDTLIRNNIGYVSENSGTATIADGRTSKQLAHGLAATPTSVVVAPRGDPGPSGLWVSARDGTNITVGRNGARGALDFDWYAEST